MKEGKEAAIAWKEKGVLFNRPHRVRNKLYNTIAFSNLVPPRLKVRLREKMGVRFKDPESVFIGANVFFDEMYPENISVGSNVYITIGTIILAHFYDPAHEDHFFREGKVVIEDDVFIGANVVISSGVTIGRGAVVGAGAVVTKDVEPMSIVGGIPAKKIGVRGGDKG